MKTQLFLYVILLGLVVNLLANMIWKYIPKTSMHIDKVVTGILVIISIVLLAFYQGERKTTERKIKFQVHRAQFKKSQKKYYFINITNLSDGRAIEVTHLWYEDQKSYIPIKQPSRSLPVRLEPDQSWESFIDVTNIPYNNRKNPYNNFRTRLSNGEVFSSEQNLSVPPSGSVPGGPIYLQ